MRFRLGVLVAALAVVGFVPLAAPAAPLLAHCQVVPAAPRTDGDTLEEVADETTATMNVAEHTAFTVNVPDSPGISYQIGRASCRERV